MLDSNNWFRKTLLSPRFWLGKNKFSDEPSQLSVTVVIPAWNEEAFIARTIESVLAQDYPCRLIIVNDRSTDRTSEIAEKYTVDYPGVCLLNVTEKAGSKSQALNRALPYIDTDIFVCVDADTELEPDSLGKLMRAFNNPNVQVASGFVIAKNSRNFWQGARAGEYIVGQSITKGAQENINAVLVASGCFFAIRSKLLLEHGFDNRTMAEDMDLTWIAIEAGYDVAFVQDARCYVTDPDSWQLYQKQIYRWYAGMFQCIKQRNGNLFSKNPKLGIAVYFYLLSSVIGVPAAIVFLAFSVVAWPIQTAGFLALVYGITVVVAIVYGIKHGQSVARYPLCIFYMMVASFVNYGVFAQAGINELFTKRTLTTWIKGH